MTDSKNPTLDTMAAAGMHFGAHRSRRHPSTKNFTFGAKNDIEMIDLEKTLSSIEKAAEFAKRLGDEGKPILLVGNKTEAREPIKKAAERAGLPYVALRWMGGTLTNFDEIKKRVARLEELESKGESGELGKYTKKERARLAHELKNLKRFFSGIVDMAELPKAMFVVDSDHEEIAITEAKKIGIPVIAFSNTDCNVSSVDYPIIGNDKSGASIKFVVDHIVSAWKNRT